MEGFKNKAKSKFFLLVYCNKAFSWLESVFFFNGRLALLSFLELKHHNNKNFIYNIKSNQIVYVDFLQFDKSGYKWLYDGQFVIIITLFQQNKWDEMKVIRAGIIENMLFWWQYCNKYNIHIQSKQSKFNIIGRIFGEWGFLWKIYIPESQHGK